MFHTVIEAGPDGTVLEGAGRDQQVADAAPSCCAST